MNLLDAIELLTAPFHLLSAEYWEKFVRAAWNVHRFDLVQHALVWVDEPRGSLEHIFKAIKDNKEPAKVIEGILHYRAMSDDSHRRDKALILLNAVFDPRLANQSSSDWVFGLNPSDEYREAYLNAATHLAEIYVDKPKQRRKGKKNDYLKAKLLYEQVLRVRPYSVELLVSIAKTDWLLLGAEIDQNVVEGIIEKASASTSY